MKISGELRKKSALHHNRGTGRGAEAEPLGQVQPEPIQQRCLGGIWAHHAAEAEGPTVGRGEYHIGTLDAVEFGEDRAGALPQPRSSLPLFQGFPQDVGQEADEDMGLNAIGSLMPDGAEPQFALLDVLGSAARTRTWCWRKRRRLRRPNTESPR